MSAPCEVLIRCRTASEAETLASLAFTEAMRIERKYSRYRTDNIVHRINSAAGATVELDDESSQLIDYASRCHALSSGMFDITSGVLRRAWTFDGREVQPDSELISRLLKLVGWSRAKFDGKSLRLEPHMQIDLGGLGKEYAVDRVAQMLFDASGYSLMVNFGGDIRAIAASDIESPWSIGVENPSASEDSAGIFELGHGAAATSGNSHRYCIVNGARLGHILNPLTGWPVADAPRSVTVVADYCVEAGFLSTLALLHGAQAEEFLNAQNVVHLCLRD